MKSVIAFLFVLGIIGASAGSLKLPPEVMDLLKGISQTCSGETGIPDSLIQEIRQAKLPNDPKAKCYIKCVMMHLQAMKEDGSLDIDLIEASLPDVVKQHGAMETVQKCKDVRDADLCETAYQMVLCFKKQNPELAAMFE